MTSTTIQTIIAAIEKAQGNWTSCHWEMDMTGDELAEYEASVEASAARAEAHGDTAITALERCDWAAALAALKAASDEELTWGDCPTWGPVVEAALMAAGIRSNREDCDDEEGQDGVVGYDITEVAMTPTALCPVCGSDSGAPEILLDDEWGIEGPGPLRCARCGDAIDGVELVSR